MAKPLQYSSLENQGSLAGYSPCGRKESDTVEVTEHIDTWGGGNDLIAAG